MLPRSSVYGLFFKAGGKRAANPNLGFSQALTPQAPHPSKREACLIVPEERSSTGTRDLITGATAKGQLALVSGHTGPACRGNCPHTNSPAREQSQHKRRPQAPLPTDSRQQRQQFKYTELIKKCKMDIKLKVWKNRIKIITFHTENNEYEVINNNPGYEGRLICRVRESCFSESRLKAPFYNGKHYLSVAKISVSSLQAGTVNLKYGFERLLSQV